MLYSLEDQPLGSDFDLYYSLFDLEISVAQTDLFSWVSPIRGDMQGTETILLQTLFYKKKEKQI
jgi:hypothetical protein